MKQDWKERLLKAVIEAVIAFITAFTVASCTVAAVADKETGNVVETSKPMVDAPFSCPDYSLIDFSHDDRNHLPQEDHWQGDSSAP